MSSFEQRRIRDLTVNILDDYDRNSEIKKFLDFETVEETDGTFTHVYFRPLVERIWFTNPGYYPAYHSFGGTVARGEVAHFIDRLRENVEAEELNESMVGPRWLRSIIATMSYEYDNVSILAPAQSLFQKFMVDSEWNPLYNYTTRNFEVRLNGFRIPIFGINKKTIQNEMIILNRECCRMRFRLFHYVEPDRDSTLSVEIRPYESNNDKMDILVHSVVKIDICRSRLAKVFRVVS